MQRVTVDSIFPLSRKSVTCWRSMALRWSVVLPSLRVPGIVGFLLQKAYCRPPAGGITREDVVKKIFKEIAPNYTERSGGYTRITRTGVRRGDAAETAMMEGIVPYFAGLVKGFL